MTTNIELEHGYLWPAIVERSKQARQNGALEKIDCADELRSDGGIEFRIRQLAKPQSSGIGHPGDPFFDCATDLFIGDLSDHHYCLLKSQTTTDHRFLIVTREFEHQESLLKLRDFVALCLCLKEVDGLAIYDGGAVAGATQPHKHLHVVPLIDDTTTTAVPIERAFASARGPGPHIRNVAGLPFQHAFTWLSDSVFEQRRNGAITLYDIYVDLMESLGIRGTRTEGTFWQPASYNLLLTRRWMILVPRTAKTAYGVPINGLAVSGTLLIGEPGQRETVIKQGPMSLLRAVTRARS